MRNKVYETLMAKANVKTGIVQVVMKDLAQELDVDYQRLTRAVKALKNDGLIELDSAGRQGTIVTVKELRQGITKTYSVPVVQESKTVKNAKAILQMEPDFMKELLKYCMALRGTVEELLKEVEKNEGGTVPR